jgi:Zn-dependent peptidase ImmA (M78 family)
MPGGIAIDVEAILRDYGGFDVARVPNLNARGKPLLGLLVPDHNLVAIEARCMQPRQRFSMAHELGHAELEHDFGTARSLLAGTSETFTCTDADERGVEEHSRRAGARRRSEVRANRFAATLLMPDALFREVWRMKPDIDAAATSLMVSREAATYRLRDLRLV